MNEQFNVDGAKKEFLIHNTGDPKGVKSLKMRVDHINRVVSYVVDKYGLVQIFTNLAAAVKKYNE